MGFNVRIAVLAVAAAVLAPDVSLAYEWRGVAPDSRIGGRLLSAGYLRGKVVVLDVRDYALPEPDRTRKVQALWDAYKTKPFVAIGVHSGSADADSVAEAGRLLADVGASYPVYAGVALEGVELRPGSLYVVDSTCTRVLYSGRDVRMASGAAGSAILETKLPSTPVQWRNLLESEIDILPGRALNRLDSLFRTPALSKEFALAYPEEFARYRALREEYSRNAEIRELAKLVQTADDFKDTDFTAKDARKVSRDAVARLKTKGERLKNSENEFVAQEARNAVADIMFAEAAAKNAQSPKGAAKRNQKGKK
jgi:hypothetical protein